MPEIDIVTIIAIEIALVFAVICAILVAKVKSLNELITKLKQKIISLLKKLGLNNTNANIEEYLSSEAEKTDAYFESLNPKQKIESGITDNNSDSSSLAIRHYFLQAEREILNIEEDETRLHEAQSKYQSIISTLNTIPNDELKALEAANEALQNELLDNKTTMSQLQQVQKHHDDMETQLEAYKEEAQSHIDSINQLTEDEVSNDIKESLDAYAKSYADISALFAEGENLPENITTNTQTDAEIENLRQFAANQHKMITELQQKLRNQSKLSHDEQTINHINSELKRQKQFVKESEVCMQLMEDELANANREIKGLRAELSTSSQKKQSEENKELELALIKEENNKLKQQIASNNKNSQSS